MHRVNNHCIRVCLCTNNTNISCIFNARTLYPRNHHRHTRARSMSISLLVAKWRRVNSSTCTFLFSVFFFTSFHFTHVKRPQHFLWQHIPYRVCFYYTFMYIQHFTHVRRTRHNDATHIKRIQTNKWLIQQQAAKREQKQSVENCRDSEKVSLNPNFRWLITTHNENKETQRERDRSTK